MPDIRLKAKDSKDGMENFPFNAQHSGAINHAHSFHFDSTVLSTLKELRLVATIIVGGWVAVTIIRTLESNWKDKGGR